MHRHRLERVLVVTKDFRLAGLMTVKDITKATDHPFAAKDAQGKLLAGAAVSVGQGTEERVEKLVDAGVDVIVVDTAHGHSKGVLDRVKWVKQHYPNLQVIGGNIATGEAALAHYPHRCRCRRAPDFSHQQCRRSSSGHRCSLHRRRRHPLLGRYFQGHRGRR